MMKGVAGLGLGLLLALTACGGSGGARLTYPAPMNTVTEGAARVHQGDTVSIGAMVGCLDKAGSVTITDITPMRGVGLKVTGWALRPNPFWKPPPVPVHPGGQILVARRTLAELHFPATKKVDVKCGKNGEAYEFAVQVLKTTSGEAGASGWVVTYTTGGETRRLGFPLAVRLCNENSADAKRCTALKV